MEHEQRDNKKRVRQGNEEHMIPSEKHAKTNDDYLDGNFDLRNEDVLEYNKRDHNITGNCSFKMSSSSDSHDYCDLALGVFDFPWLKDGVISETDNRDYWNFEDVFSSSLEYDLLLHTTSTGDRTEFSNFSWQCFYDETVPDKKVEYQQDKPKIEEDVCHAPSS